VRLCDRGTRGIWRKIIISKQIKRERFQDVSSLKNKCLEESNAAKADLTKTLPLQRRRQTSLQKEEIVGCSRINSNSVKRPNFSGRGGRQRGSDDKGNYQAQTTKGIIRMGLIAEGYPEYKLDSSPLIQR